MPKAAQHHALARQWHLLRLLPSKMPGITSRALADKLEREGFAVTKRTIERDLAELSTIFGIACNDKGMPYGWHWMPGEYAELPGLSVSDAVSLRLLEDLLRPLLPHSLLQAMESRFAQANAKLKELSPGNARARWADKVRYVPPALPRQPPHINDGILEAVQEALLNDLQICVSYQKPSDEPPTQLQLHPLGLIQRGEIAYLVATAFAYEDVRLYAVHRIQTVEVSADAVRQPAGFSLDDYLQAGGAQFRTGEPVHFRAWISSELAAVLREAPIHESQSLAPSGDGWQLSAMLADSWQLRWWILSQGALIRVIEPTNLRDGIAQEIRNMHVMYTSPHQES